jgi:Flp pilus assembly pilin Flp
MLTHLKSFGRDEHGFVISTELVLIATLCVLGLVTALSCVRDAVNGELQDVAGAIGSLNQSYCFTGFHGCVSPQCGTHARTAGSMFTDLRDEEAAADIEGGPAVQVAPAVEQTPAPVVAPPVIAPPMITEPAHLPCPQPAPMAVESAPLLTAGPALPGCACEASTIVGVTAAPINAAESCCPTTNCQPAAACEPTTICPSQPICQPGPTGFLVW